jgi:hypothetical protein
MVCVNLVDQGRVAPADGLFAQPVKGVLGHCGKEA